MWIKKNRSVISAYNGSFCRFLAICLLLLNRNPPLEPEPVQIFTADVSSLDYPLSYTDASRPMHFTCTGTLEQSISTREICSADGGCAACATANEWKLYIGSPCPWSVYRSPPPRLRVLYCDVSCYCTCASYKVMK